tara:strand:+ start:4282 stop:4593 length:312 start_codon:yes stop_codon:yes gene_type:complete
MLDYYSSFLKPKYEIYRETISRFPTYSESYIRSKIDYLYETEYINDTSVSGWMVFVGPSVVEQINILIKGDLDRSNKRLLLAKCLVKRDDISLDIIESIIKMA